MRTVSQSDLHRNCPVVTDREFRTELSVQVAHDPIAASFQYPKLSLSIMGLRYMMSTLGQPRWENKAKQKLTASQLTVSSGGTPALASWARTRSNTR